MSAEVISFAVPVREATSVEPVPVTKEWEAAAAKLVRRGYGFKLANRLDASRLNAWKRWAYEYFVRRVSVDALRVPPAIPLDLAVPETLEEAFDACEGPDDQVHVLPKGWVYERDVIHTDVVCRPKDPADGLRTQRMRELFGGTEAERRRECQERVESMHWRILDLDRRLTRLEGRKCDAATNGGIAP